MSFKFRTARASFFSYEKQARTHTPEKAVSGFWMQTPDISTVITHKPSSRVRYKAPRKPALATRETMRPMTMLLFLAVATATTVTEVEDTWQEDLPMLPKVDAVSLDHAFDMRSRCLTLLLGCRRTS